MFQREIVAFINVSIINPGCPSRSPSLCRLSYRGCADRNLDFFTVSFELTGACRGRSVEHEHTLPPAKLIASQKENCEHEPTFRMPRSFIYCSFSLLLYVFSILPLCLRSFSRLKSHFYIYSYSPVSFFRYFSYSLFIICMFPSSFLNFFLHFPF
jgi:hypothetical protein